MFYDLDSLDSDPLSFKVEESEFYFPVFLFKEKSISKITLSRAVSSLYLLYNQEIKDIPEFEFDNYPVTLNFIIFNYEESVVKSFNESLFNKIIDKKGNGQVIINVYYYNDENKSPTTKKLWTNHV